MTESTDSLSRDEAQEALDSAAKMKSADWRQGVPERWFGAVIAALIGSMFAIYALEDPGNYIVFPILTLAVFAAMAATAREKSGAYGREIPDDKAGVWKLALFAVVLMIVFFGSIIIRRTYDAAWVPLVVGVLVAIVVFAASKRERRAYLAMADQGDAE